MLLRRGENCHTGYCGWRFRMSYLLSLDLCHACLFPDQFFMVHLHFAVLWFVEIFRRQLWHASIYCQWASKCKDGVNTITPHTMRRWISIFIDGCIGFVLQSNQWVHGLCFKPAVYWRLLYFLSDVEDVEDCCCIIFSLAIPGDLWFILILIPYSSSVEDCCCISYFRSQFLVIFDLS